MTWSGKTVAGLALLAFGICALLGILGIHLGGLIAFFVGIVLACYGLKKLKDGRKGRGIVALIFALILLGSSLPFLISMAFAAVCIYFGWRLIKKEDHSEPAVTYSGNGNTAYKEVEVDDHFETEWKDFLKKNRNDDN